MGFPITIYGGFRPTRDPFKKSAAATINGNGNGNGAPPPQVEQPPLFVGGGNGQGEAANGAKPQGNRKTWVVVAAVAALLVGVLVLSRKAAT